MKDHFKKIARLPRFESADHTVYDQQAAIFIEKVNAGQEECVRPSIKIPIVTHAEMMYKTKRKRQTVQNRTSCR